MSGTAERRDPGLQGHVNLHSEGHTKGLITEIHQQETPLLSLVGLLQNQQDGFLSPLLVSMSQTFPAVWLGLLQNQQDGFLSLLLVSMNQMLPAVWLVAVRLSPLKLNGKRRKSIVRTHPSHHHNFLNSTLIVC